MSRIALIALSLLGSPLLGLSAIAEAGPLAPSAEVEMQQRPPQSPAQRARAACWREVGYRNSGRGMVPTGIRLQHEACVQRRLSAPRR